jgi:hypothetical protein
MVGIFGVTCGKCGAGNKSGARFCGECGSPLAGSMVTCNSCGAPAAADKRFCGQCGKPLGESAAPSLTGNRWARKEGDFATKVEVTDVDGFFKKGLIVEAGTKAIFFVNGAYSGIVDPGKYDVGGLLAKIKNLFDSKTTTAVLLDTGDIEVTFSCAGLATTDPLKLSVDCTVVAQMDNPTAFFENMMKGRQNYRLAELQQFLEGEVHNALSEFIGARSVQTLSSNIAVKHQMEQAVANHLARTFERKGLSFVQVRVINLRHPHLDKMSGQMEEYWVHEQDLKAQIAAGGTMPLERKLLDQDTARMLMQVEVYEDRAKVYERMQQAVNGAQMSEVSNQAQLETFLLGQNKGKLLRDEEILTLTRGFAERTQDHELERTHLLQMLDARRKGELQKAHLAETLSLDTMMDGHERGKRMAQLQEELDQSQRAFDQKLGQERALAAKEREDDEKDLEIGLKALRAIKGVKREEADAEADRALRLKKGESEIAMTEEQLRHQREMEKYAKLASMAPEALIAVAPADQAAILAELRRTDLLRNCTEEQILAMAAQNSPQVAEALKEKFSGTAGRQLMERMLKEKDDHAAQLRDMAAASQRTMQQMFEHALNTQRDTAVAATRSGIQPGPTVVVPGMGAAGVVGPGAAGGGRVVVCPQCHLPVDEGVKFCGNCSHSLYG